MTGKNTGNAGRALLLLIALIAALAFAASACADDAEQLKLLPGRWIFSVPGEEQGAEEEAPQADLAFLTLEEGGKMTLLCNGRDGQYRCTLEGVWSSEFVPDGIDRLTLQITSTDDPAKAGSESRAECAYSFYTESWVEEDILHTYLILEEESGISPFAEVYGEDGEWSVALHREQGPNMRIANCKEYVSLREKRAASSKRLAKVPLGALVLAFPEAGEEDGFIQCVYRDEYGYIQAKYLQPIE